MSEEQSIRLTVCGVTDVGVEREHNEDAFTIADVVTGDAIDGARPPSVDVAKQPMLLAVADGMGGENAGEIASALTLDKLRDNLARSLMRSDLPGSLTAAVQQTHSAVVEAATQPGRDGMGSTLVAALISGTRAYVASVGDSRAYLLHESVLTQITKDQSLLQRLIDEGQIEPDKVAEFPYRNVILQAVGRAATPTLWVPLAEVSLHRGDVLLLCSDGLSGEVDDAELQSILAAPAPLELTAARLISRANERGGHDNITVILAAVKDAP